MNKTVLAVGALICVPLVWLLAEGFGRDPHALPSVMEGKPAPDFALSTMDGVPIRLAELRGRPVVLNFWASWCVPCLQEHPGVQKVASLYTRRGVVFLGVIYGDTPEAAQEFLNKHGSAYPSLIDPEQRTAIDYGVAGVPETFVITRDGQIARKFVGPVSQGDLSMTLESLL